MEIPRSKYSEEISDHIGCHADVLDCSTLPTGTHKILKARRAIDAVAGKRVPILISSGNYAKAIMHEVERIRIKVIIVMDGNTSDVKGYNPEFTEMVDKEALIRAFAEAIKDRSFGSPEDLLGPRLEFAYSAYTTGEVKPGNTINITNLDDIGFLEERHFHPTYDALISSAWAYDKVFCPVGSGELFYDLYTASPIRKSHFYGVTPIGHPAVSHDRFTERTGSLADKLITPCYPIRDFHFNFYDLLNKGKGERHYEERRGGGLVLKGHFSDPDSMRGEKYYHYTPISEDEIRSANNLATGCGFNAEMSASVGFACMLDSFRERNQIAIDGPERVLIVNTGNGDKF